MSHKTLRISVSGGKDSTATLLLALENNWLNDVVAVFADTGNEHPITLDYLDYLSGATGLKITTVRADFSKQMAVKRDKLLRIAAGVPESEIYGNRKFSEAWTPARAARAAEIMVPTGVPFIDVCLLRGGFPSRKRQFCTEELKSMPLELHTMKLLSEGAMQIEDWHGIRAEESRGRAKYPDYEWGPIISVRRPILRWGIDRVFEQHRRHNIKPNPLYSMGMKRVGCMPCINSSKDEILEISKRFPEHIDKIRAWETLMSEAVRQSIGATFFHVRTAKARGIAAAVEWAGTSFGGVQQDFIRAAAPETCSSAYGLCE